MTGSELADIDLDDADGEMAKVEELPWTEDKIATALALQVFNKRAVVITPNCTWTGHECDLLVVTEKLFIVDVEIKISRADLKADADKTKWWHREFRECDVLPDGLLPTSPGVRQCRDWRTGRPFFDVEHRSVRDWPPRVRQHYYAMPASIWKPDLVEILPSDKSGILLVSRDKYGRVFASCHRRAVPNKEATKLTPAQVLDVARLANIRLWSSREVANTGCRNVAVENLRFDLSRARQEISNLENEIGMWRSGKMQPNLARTREAVMAHGQQ